MKYLNENSEIQLNNTAVALGKFDGFHRGHLLLLEELKKSKEQGFTTVVFVIDFGKNSILDIEERDNILSSYNVDYLISFKFTTEFAAIEAVDFVNDILIDKLGIRRIIVGLDYRFGYNRNGDVSFLEEMSVVKHFEVVAKNKLNLLGEIVSSTRIRNAISEGDVETAGVLLGRYYSLNGEIVHGRHLGNTIGFPTINVSIPSYINLVKEGVYASRITIDGNIYYGMTNVGKNPTVSEDNSVTIETHIFDFDSDVYGKKAKVELIYHIRDEIKFNSLQELKSQLQSDIITIRERLHQ